MQTKTRYRLAPTLLIACVALVGCSSKQDAIDSAAIPLTRSGKPDFSGVWKIASPVAALKTLEGASPPLLSAAAALHQARQGDKSWDTTRKCKPPGEPRILSFEQRPFEIGQRDNSIAFMFEWNRLVRSIPITTQTLQYNGPFYFGQSQAQWDGESLVIEVQGVHEEVALDDSGLPHTDNIKLSERFTLINGGQQLQATISIDDGATFSKPWQTRLLFDRQQGVRIQEDFCIERLGLQDIYPSLPLPAS